MKASTILRILLILIASACTAVQAHNGESDLANSKWKLVSFGESKAEIPVIERSTITLEFDDKGRFGGSGGCNSYGGSYSVEEGKLKFGEIIKGVLNFVRASTSTPDSSQSRERIEFELVYSSATRIGDLPEGGMKEYVVAAAAGQIMHIQTVGYSAPVEFTLSGPSGETWTSEQQASDVNLSTAEVILPQNGDYLVRLVVPQGTEATRYEITFTIETGSLPTIPSPTEPPETVNFAAGATSAQRSGTLPGGPALKQYALAGKAGQMLAVEINNADVPISISFTTPSGMTGFRSGHKFTLDDTGFYIVTLSKTGETPSTDYIVVFTIH